jgi:putative ATP-dependent endonuclease of the OLD family
VGLRRAGKDANEFKTNMVLIKFNIHNINKYMIIEDKIQIKNYKCFDSVGGGFDKVFPINIIIGKNNSGKSSLIDLVQFLVQTNKDFNLNGRENLSPEVLITHLLTDKEISSVFSNTISRGDIPVSIYSSHYEYGKLFIGKPYTYSLKHSESHVFHSFDCKNDDIANDKIASLAGRITRPFTDRVYCNITAERDIIPEITSTISLSSNGVGATNLIQQIINRVDKDSRLIEIELLKELNTIINPDIRFNRILVQQHENLNWELFFEDVHKKRIALSKMGSGVKTVLLVLLNLIVRPLIENKGKEAYIFAFEELENNLHPSLQRRLYDYIIRYSEVNSTYFFLTTHSNIVIDRFSFHEYAQLIHIENDGNKSTTKTIISTQGSKDVLDDLGIKASDILQCNGVIWVEGPSDVIYISKWLDMYAVENNLKILTQGKDYEFQMFGGTLLDSLCLYKEESEEKELDKIVEIFSFSRNAYVIMDSDAVVKNKVIVDKSNFSNAKKYINNQFEKLDKDNLGIWYDEGNINLTTIEDYLDNKSKKMIGKPKKACAIKIVNSWTEDQKLSNFKQGLTMEIEKLYNKVTIWNK